jgi:hypothetical protein
MNEINYHHHGNEGPERARVDHDVHGAALPYWKRAHRDWRFWIGLVLMLVAMAIYVLSDDLAFLPWRPAPHPSASAIGK